ncbi:MAG: acyl-protein synthetase [Flavobacteriales bacterium]
MTTNINDILTLSPFSLNKKEKGEMLKSNLIHLTKRHYEHCQPYADIINGLQIAIDSQDLDVVDIPFIPVRLFKMFELLSVNKDDVVKTMTSSGTSGQAVSKIFLDKVTAQNQTKTLVNIVSSLLSKKRAPMIILDTDKILKDRKLFSARGAGILGFSIFGSKRIYALDENMNLKIDELKAFIEKYKDHRILLFGFTFMIHQHFYKKMLEENIHLNLKNGVLIHGGGWKKLVSESVSPKQFAQNLNEICGISAVHDYYGMVEQTGSIFLECNQGYLHASNFSDIIIRRAKDFSVANFGEKGIIQVLSILPESYPGHSLLTEDEGIIFGEDDCKCGNHGKYFKILGRLKSAEIRGCSDTYTIKKS